MRRCDRVVEDAERQEHPYEPDGEGHIGGGSALGHMLRCAAVPQVTALCMLLESLDRLARRNAGAQYDAALLVIAYYAPAVIAWGAGRWM